MLSLFKMVVDHLDSTIDQLHAGHADLALLVHPSKHAARLYVGFAND